MVLRTWRARRAVYGWRLVMCLRHRRWQVVVRLSHDGVLDFRELLAEIVR